MNCLFCACLPGLFLCFLFGSLLCSPTNPFFFLPSSWTQCTTSCGPGYQMRAVKCVVGSYGAVMDDTECNAATRPTDTQVRMAIPSSSLFFFSLEFLSFTYHSWSQISISPFLGAAGVLGFSNSFILWTETEGPMFLHSDAHTYNSLNSHIQTYTHISFPPGLNKAMLSDLVWSREKDRRGGNIGLTIPTQAHHSQTESLNESQNAAG